MKDAKEVSLNMNGTEIGPTEIACSMYEEAE